MYSCGLSRRLLCTAHVQVLWVKEEEELRSWEVTVASSNQVDERRRRLKLSATLRNKARIERRDEWRSAGKDPLDKATVNEVDC